MNMFPSVTRTAPDLEDEHMAFVNKLALQVAGDENNRILRDAMF
jgi:hypothetical protein